MKLVLSREFEPHECVDGYQVTANWSLDTRKQDVGGTENQSVDVGPHNYSTAGSGKAKFKTKPDKGVKLKYIPKQKTIV